MFSSFKGVCTDVLQNIVAKFTQNLIENIHCFMFSPNVLSADSFSIL